MKRYAQRIFWFTLAILLLTTLVWTGTAVAETNSDGRSDKLQACDYNNSNIRLGRAPAQFSNPAKLVNKTQYSDFNHVASEDWLAIQFPKSNDTSCSYNRSVGSNIAYASPATPSANTTHTVVPVVNEPISELEQISIEYEIRPHLNNNLYKNNITLFGVDENQDGFIEKSLNNSIEYVSAPDSNTIQFSLDGNATIPSDSYLVVRYEGISNPEYTDTHTVNTTIVGNRTETDRGEIKYSTNLTGLLGHGTELSISRDASRLVTLRPSKTAITNDSVYLFLPTQPNIDRRNTYSLTVGDGQLSNVSTLSHSQAVVANYTVFGRFAYVFSNPKIKNDTISIQGYTNVAPGSIIAVQVYDMGRLREKTVTVDGSQSLSVNITLPNELLKSDVLFINVLDYNRSRLGQGVYTRRRLPTDFSRENP
ncbi:hypothetical protein SAMN05216388_101419 [Halorientalis persicus]|uniref:Uncharacterized protein n=1 Tax=Halorientalis persicus TaxID=1367881 RepID=A0A1H8QJL2_9EURY|nr:hypothetical protein [Halorientalis persicus]SEO54094.1 hypothetical protein SAMN05216388_101419 [Halorientalis persicus]